ncbi:Cut9-interacting protein scn1 [Escovopsis weberi]|uniref:Cut9-interacting protein scn1 n=1 Tax=Escovopsis weberi TaxID=150374 RepID=A0A0M8MXQ4_ESCWE|nr:Cut9-interacting protein scn1 [Escovopsis weberi]
MRATTLAIMATRSQDQQLVAQMASSHGSAKPPPPSSSLPSHPPLDAREAPAPCAVVPSFGWHPWFSHQLYDDTTTTTIAAGTQPTTNEADGKHCGDDAPAASKTAHYQSVLQPAPKDGDFIASLPDPAPLSAFISATRKHLEAFPHALVGEVGLDKAFRLPQQWDASDAAARDDSLTPGSREGRLLSPYRVRMAHQQAVMRAQLRLAGELQRAVSVHGVQAHGVLYDSVSALWKGHERRVLSRREKRMDALMAAQGRDADADADASGSSSSEDEDEDGGGDSGGIGSLVGKPRGKPFPPRICLHSYTGSVDMLKQWLHPAVPCRVFLSFSTAVNLGTGGGRARLEEVLRAVPDDRLLVESDLHVAGEQMDAALEDMYRLVCGVKGWDLESGVRTVGKNFERFIYG